MIARKGFLVLALTFLLGTLAACDSVEERAEKHFQTALALLEENDEERAIVEFRNVFQLNDQHRAARLAFAQLQERRGNPHDAFGHYLFIAERFPDDIGSQKALARIAADLQNWDAARRHLGAGLALVPDDKELLAVKVGTDYAQAVQDSDENARRNAALAAQVMIADFPDKLLLRRVIIDNHIQDQNFNAALNAVDEAIKVAPDERALYKQRLALMFRLGDHAGVEQGLIRLIDLFPDEPAHEATLVRWYASRGETEKAEAFLRARISPDDATPDARLSLVSYLNQAQGAQAALDELNKIITDDKQTLVFRGMRAGLMFELGEKSAGIDEMQALLEEAVPDDQTRAFKVALARMHAISGDSVSARALLEEVLAEDSGQVEALKMKATWLIEDDDLDQATALLRTAQDQSPKDAQILMLMAKAYERSGNTALMADAMSRAVDVSNNAPAESINYARLLIRDGKLLPAESVLLNALRLTPNNVDILMPLGQLYVQMKDWGRATAVGKNLERIDTAEATGAGRALKAAILQGQNLTSESLDYLQGLIEEGQSGLGAQVAILRTHLTGGDVETARQYADSILAENPEDPSLRFIHAAVLAASGDVDGAENQYRQLLAEDPTRTRVWTALYGLLIGVGHLEQAESALDKALLANPEDASLLWVRASVLERNNDIDGAIAIYEDLYARNTSNTVIANNLASLLASFRNDQASLERAYAVARRLQSTNFPPFQDTYGWIIHLRGESAEAVNYLEPASLALRNDPLVQFHLAQVYAALGQSEDAVNQYRKVVEMVGELDKRDFVMAARTELVRMQSSE